MTNYSRSVLLSNGLHHSENLPVKFGFSPKIVPANIVQKVTVTTLFQTAFHRIFQLLAQTAHTFAFTGESGYTLGFRRKIAHSGTHGETGAFQDGAAITTLDTYCTFTNIPGPGARTAYFAALGSCPGGALEERREPSGQRCAYARRCPEGCRSPAGLRDLFRFCRNCGLYALRSGPFRVCEARGGITLEMSRNVQSGNTQNLKSSAASDQAAVCACARSRYFAGGSPSGLRI